MRSVPLWLVFSLQSLVVAGAFIAVILVLVLQQKEEYKASVFREINLQLHLAESALVGPIITRETSFQQVVDRMKADPSIHMQAEDTMASPNVQRFLNFTFLSVYSDPLVYAFFQQRMHPTKQLPATSVNGPLYFGALAITNENNVFISEYNGNMSIAPNPSFPLQFSTVVHAPLEVSNLDFSLIARNNIYGGQWMRPGVFFNTLTGNAQPSTSISYPIEINTTLGVATLSVVGSILAKYLVDLAKESLLTPTSRGLLLERILPSNNFIIAGMNTNTPEYDVAAEALFTTSNFPDQVLVSQYFATESRCPSTSNCTFFAEDDGENIMSLIFMNTRFNYKMSLFQVTPRDQYFAAGERATLIGILIGVVAAVVVLVSCIVIWFAVRNPVNRLRESMELAAVMRNDEVGDTSSVLTEIDRLSHTFVRMNGKLLQARSFMPQSMLFGEEDLDDDATTDGEPAEDEGGLDEVSSLYSGGTPIGGKSPAIVSPTPSNNFDRTASNDISRTSRQSVHGSSVVTSNSNTNSSRHSNGIVIPQKCMLHPRKVAVLVINARGTHTLSIHGGSLKLEREQVRLVELVEHCARAEKGVVDAFQGDHFVVTFNAVREVGAAGRNAATMALSVEDGAHKDGLALGSFSMGLSVGRAQVGSVGSATLKKNCTVGPVFSKAVELERIAKAVGRNCLVNGRAMAEIEIVAYCLSMGTISFPSTGGSDKDTTDTIWAVMSRVEGNADEWLYEMEEAAKGNPYQAYNDAVAVCVAGHIEEGIAALKMIQNNLVPTPGHRLLDATEWMLKRLEDMSSATPELSRATHFKL